MNLKNVKQKDKQTCISCNVEKKFSEFYKTKAVTSLTGYSEFCKECLCKIDYSDKNNLIDVLQKLNMPYIDIVWKNILEKNTSNYLGNYLKIINTIKYKDKTFKDSDNYKENVEQLEDIFEKINKANKDLEKVENKLQQKKIENESFKKNTNEYDIDDLQRIWGSGFSPRDYIDFQKKYEDIIPMLPNDHELSLEFVKKYIQYNILTTRALAQGDVDTAKKLSELERASAKQAKITPEQLTNADLSQGIDNFSTLVSEVEKAVGIIPILPQFISEGRDKVDDVIFFYINYERDLHTMPLIEYKDIYNFYNERASETIEGKPTVYSFLDDEMVNGNTPVEKVYNYVFNVVIPKKKKENPHSSFYRNLDKWVTLVSFYRWYPDLFYDFISPRDKNGNIVSIKLGLDQRVALRGMARFKEVHTVLSRGSGKCVVGDTMLFTSDGIKEIGSYFNYDRSNKEKIIEQEICTLNRFGKKEKSPRGIYSGYKETKHFFLDGGIEIETTLNHKLLKKSSNDLIWEEAKDLKINDVLLLNKNNDLWGNRKYIECKSNKKYIKEYKIEIDKKISSLLGYLLSFDINVLLDDSIIFNNINYQEKKLFKDFLYKEYNVQCIEDFMEYNDLGINEKFFIYLIKKIGINKDFLKSNFKYIPTYFLETNKKNIIYFLKIFIRNKLKLQNNRALIELKSKKLVNQLQMIFLNLGIFAHKYYDSDKIYLEFYKKDLQKLNELLELNFEIDYIKDYNYYEDDNYYYLKILNIESNENDVYDIYMPNTNSFIGNGIVNHNTMLGNMYAVHTCIFYPDTLMSLSAQTKDNASSLIKDKFFELLKLYPMLEEEYYPSPKSIIKASDIRLNFKSGSVFDNLVNNQSTKGKRRTRLIIEESAQINNKLFVDVLAPVVKTTQRKTLGLRIPNPLELDGQILFFTTSWYRGTSEFERCIQVFDDMIKLKGSFAIGSSYELNIAMERGASKSEIESEREKSVIYFATNYESKWIGAGEGALIELDKVLGLRTLEKPELVGDPEGEYIISVDVARSVNANNDHSSIVILKINRSANTQKINNIALVNMLNFTSLTSFEDLSLEIKRLKLLYNAKAIVLDTNGLGIGLLEKLATEQFDTLTGESLGSYKPFNENLEYGDDNAEKIVYSFKSTGINKEVIINFQDYIVNNKLKLLVKKNVVDNRFEIEEEHLSSIRPYVETDLLIDELANLKLVINNNQTFFAVQVSTKINKDRYSALAYGLFYIKRFEEYYNNDNNNINELFFYN